MSDTEKLKIGLLLDTYDVPAWVSCMLSEIEASNYAGIELVVLNNIHPQPVKSLIRRFIDNRNRLIYSLYGKLDKALNKVNPDAFACRNISKLLSSVDVVEVTPRRTKYCDYISDYDLDRIKQKKIDVLIRLGFRILKGEILQVAKYGIWSYHHADNRVNRGGPPGFWEVIDRQPVTGTILQILSGRLDDGLVLTRSYAATDTLSVAYSRNSFYWKSASFLPRELRSLYCMGEEQYFLEKRAQEGELTFYTQRLFKEPGNLELLKKLPGYWFHYFNRRIKQILIREDWFLLFRLNDSDEISTSLRQFTVIESPRDRFWADPFVISESGRYYIFIEEYMYDTEKGHLAVFEIDEKGNISKPRTIIERSYHLSYPFVFKWNDVYYMVPESSDNKTIELYRSVDFPYQWEFHKVLMDDVVAVDSTLYEYNGKWWLFANVREYEGASKHDELYLFYAESPLSDSWKAHPGNPIVSDVRKARPAGRLFSLNNAIYRPSQDCSVDYGRGLVLNKVLEMTETRYYEKTVQSMEADWDNSLTGIHTLSHELKLTVIDAKRSKFKLFY